MQCVTSVYPTERMEGMLAGKSAQVTEKETCTTAAEGCRRKRIACLILC